MSPDRRLKHLPEAEWPPKDRLLFERAFSPGRIFEDDVGPGAHLSEGTRKTVRFGWRRWLGFLAAEQPADLLLSAADRITPDRVRVYVEHLHADMMPSSVATTLAHLYDGARLIAPDHDWNWLKAVKRRLQARARPQDRFERLAPAHKTLDLGLTLMETADSLPANGRLERQIQFRDGLIIAILSLWPIRRRSLAALTLTRHVKRAVGDDHIEVLLFPEDTKSGRMERWPVAKILLPYMTRYLDEVRPRLARPSAADALWLGQHGHRLSAAGVYSVICRRTMEAYGLPMTPHDFRRAAATFLAMDAPEKVGLTSGILQHTNPETSERYYNLSRGISASRRHSATLAELRTRLRSGMR